MLQIMTIGEDRDLNPEPAEMNIVRALFREYAQELGEDLCFQSFDAELQDPLKKYGSPGGALLLAYWEGEPTGCVAFTPMKDAGACEMKRLYVRPAYRAHGIAAALVKELLERAVAQGYAVMRLDTLERLQPAIRLYERFGFTRTGAYYANPLAEVVYMEKVLGV